MPTKADFPNRRNREVRTSGIHMYKDNRLRPDCVRQPVRNDDADRRVSADRLPDCEPTNASDSLAFASLNRDEFDPRGSSGHSP